MILWSMSPINNRSLKALGSRLKTLASSLQPPASSLIGMLMTTGMLCSGVAPAAWAAVERDPVTLRVIAVNPSAEKSKIVPVRIELPQEITPKDIVDHGDLDVEFDEERSLYYVYKADVNLAPKQTKVFEVVVRDVWFVPDAEFTSLKSQTDLLLHRLERSEYYASAKQLSESIVARLDEIQKMQSDESISRKQRIGAYRRNLVTIQEVKDDLARMEKLLAFAGGPPVPEMLKESPLKSDAPSTTTTWLVIFLIVIFMGLLAGQFFFTWQRRVKSTTDGTSEEVPIPQGPHETPQSLAAGTGASVPPTPDRH